MRFDFEDHQGAAPSRRRPGWPAWGSFRVLWVFCIFLVSCSSVPGTTGSNRVLPQAYGVDVLAQQRLKTALRLIQEGKAAEARTILEALLKEERSARVNPSTVLYLGAMQLMEDEEAGRLEASKEYFQTCVERFPAGPRRDNAEQIVHMLEGQIAKARREGAQRKEMGSLVEQQREEIQSLNYKIQKLEEIQKETDLKRESLDLK